MVYWYVGIGGVIGSLLRYLVAVFCTSWMIGEFPFGTLTANLLGSFLLGFLTIFFMFLSEWTDGVKTAITTGIIGSFTTFSTFSVEMVKLIENGHLIYALTYFLISSIGGLLLVSVGQKLGYYLKNKRAEEFIP
ncbi:CrcB protein [Bacillus sp. cl95]|nr:CrcB protein [Bacillus sp. UNCCL13]SFQ85585.1 CrcB protein [Bacillus sp. cl95]